MRATAFMAFLLTTVGATGVAQAGVPLLAPRVSLAMALRWNQVAVTSAIVARAASRKSRLVTSGSLAPVEHGTVAYSRVESMFHDAIPHYVPRDAQNHLLRSVTVTPFAPYLGAYGLNFTVETTLLR